MTAHAKLSASGSSMWMNCPGSIKANEGFPNTSSIYAEEGTMLHAMAEMCLQQESEATTHSHLELEQQSVVQSYLDYCRGLDTKSSVAFIEERIDLSDWVPGGFGTADFGSLDVDNKHLHMVDLKCGRGVKVFAQSNTQLMMYALGLMEHLTFLYDIDTVTVHIVQPRLRHYDEWNISAKELRQWAEEVLVPAAELALTVHAPRVPGDKQCQWCKAKANCKQLSAYVEDTISAEFDDLDDINPNSLSDEKLKIILDNKSLIDAFLKAVEGRIFEQLESGKRFPGYKLVEGRSIRKWTPEAEAKLVSELGDEAYSKKLIGVGAAEKVMGRKEVAPLCIKPKGKPTLAVSSDKREALTAIQFDDES